MQEANHACEGLLPAGACKPRGSWSLRRGSADCPIFTQCALTATSIYAVDGLVYVDATSAAELEEREGRLPALGLGPPSAPPAHDVKKAKSAGRKSVDRPPSSADQEEDKVSRAIFQCEMSLFSRAATGSSPPVVFFHAFSCALIARRQACTSQTCQRAWGRGSAHGGPEENGGDSRG